MQYLIAFWMVAVLAALCMIAYRLRKMQASMEADTEVRDARRYFDSARDA